MAAMEELAADVERIAPLGHNNPPEPTPFDAISVHVEDLMVEAKNWCDGAPVESQEQADTVARLIDDFRKAYTAADNARKEENKPFDEGKAAVQAKYAPLIADTKGQRGKVILAIDTLKRTLAPWLMKLEEEKRRQAEEARRAAEEAARIAAEARAQAAATDLAAVEEAEDLLAAAEEAATDARKAEKDRAHAHGGGRAMALRSYFRAELVSASDALKHYVKVNPEAIKACLIQLATDDVRAGKRQIPGFDVLEEKRVA